MSTMVDVLVGVLTGLGWGIDPAGKHNDGSLFIAISVAAFRPLEDFKTEVTEFAKFLKASRPAQGFEAVLYPGEIEWQRTQERLRTGIPIEDETWSEIQKLAATVSVSTE